MQLIVFLAILALAAGGLTLSGLFGPLTGLLRILGIGMIAIGIVLFLGMPVLRKRRPSEAERRRRSDAYRPGAEGSDAEDEPG